MHLKDVLRNVVADILQRHVAAAAEEIAAAMADEIEALARDRLADLYPQLKPPESEASADERALDRIERQLLQARQQADDAYLVALREEGEP
jgi:hypothetical protein